MFEPLHKLNIPYSFYGINEELEIDQDIELKKGEYLVYTNYFGLKDVYSRKLAERYTSNFILDCSQAYYFEPLRGGHTFYSPRKFFGVPDGGFLITQNHLNGNLPQSTSYQRSSHLLKRVDLGAEEAYEDFKINDQSLSEEEMMSMSRLTQKLLSSIDYDDALVRRRSNYAYLQEHLNSTNEFSSIAALDEIACPMYYPLFTQDQKLRERLIKSKIFVPT
jgi:hypothetical protein